MSCRYATEIVIGICAYREAAICLAASVPLAVSNGMPLPVEICTTSAAHPSSWFDAWRTAHDLAHLDWQLSPTAAASFSGRLRTRTLAGIRIIDCRCDPCAGQRIPLAPRRGQPAKFAMLFPFHGREVVRQFGAEATLAAGDFMMWDNDQKMDFQILEPTHKITMLIPKPKMHSLLGNGDHYIGKVVRSADDSLGLAAEAFRRVARDLCTAEQSSAPIVLEPIVSLLAATLRSSHPSAQISASHWESFRRFCRYIDTHLGDSSLSPAQVAADHGVSLRYLHLVFAKQGTSFGRWLRERRLSRCHEELSQAQRSGTVTEVAFRWGFNEASHFSRVFKARYGVSPQEVRRGVRVTGHQGEPAGTPTDSNPAEP